MKGKGVGMILCYHRLLGTRDLPKLKLSSMLHKGKFNIAQLLEHHFADVRQA